MSDELDAQIIAYLSGDIDDEAFAQLDRRLQEEPDSARRFAHICDHDLVLSSVFRIRNSRPSARKARTRKSKPSLSRVFRFSAVAAAILALACTSWLLLTNHKSPIVNTDSVQTLATVETTAENVYAQRTTSNVQIALKVGAKLQQGDQLHIGEYAKFSFVYTDGTKVGIEGPSDLTLIQDGSKRIELKRGTLTAIVAPQPDGHSMRFVTPEAETEVVGTKLNISSKDKSTHLIVTEGKVRLTRNTDHQSLIVAAGFTSEVKADVTLPLALHALSTLQDDLPKDAHILYHVAFSDRPAQWLGEYANAPESPAGFIAIKTHLFQAGTRFYGEIRGPIFESGIPAGKKTYLRFRYYAAGFKSGDLIKLMLKKQDGSIFHGFVKPQLNNWSVATLRLDSKFLDLQHASRPLEAGESIHNIVFLGAAPDDRNAIDGPRLWIEEIVIFSSDRDTPVLSVEQ